MSLLILTACNHKMTPEAEICMASICRAFLPEIDITMECAWIPDKYWPRPPQWAKIMLIHEALHRYDCVFWIDADAVFLRRPNGNEILEIAVQEETLSICGDDEHVNSGVMIWRSCPQAFSFLEKVEACYGDPKYKDVPWNEQGVMELFLREITVKRLDKSIWNAFEDDVHEGSLIRHWANDSHRRRKMTLWLEYSSQQPSIAN